MSDEVFEGSPLQEYFNDVGIEDWGIEDDGPSMVYPVDDAPTPTDVPGNNEQDSSAYSNTDTTRMRPLILGSDHTFVDRERFKLFIRSSLSQKISHQETMRFLEQFRYAIVSSGLLESQPIYSLWSETPGSRRQNLLYDSRKPWTHLCTTFKMRTGRNGSIVVLCVLLCWKYRSLASKSKDKASLALVIGLVVVLYMFATSRRRLLRSLREKALVFVESFVQSAKYFDGDCVRALRDVTDIDVASAGLYSNARPLAASSGRYSRQLRAVLASSLHLLSEAYLDAFRDCAAVGSLTQVEQYFHIYGLKEEQRDLSFVISSDFIGFDEIELPYSGAAACYVSASDLKREFRKVQLVRRAFLCSVLAAESSGEVGVNELESWTTICDHLLNASNLCQQLSHVITKERLSPSTLHQEAESLAGVPRPLKMLTAATRHFNARLDILQNSYHQSNNYESLYQASQVDFEELSRAWAAFSANHRRENSGPSNVFNIEQSSYARSPTLVMTPETSEISSFSVMDAPDMMSSATEVTGPESFTEASVIEGEVASSLMPHSGLSREERIRLVKRERILAKEASLKASQHTMLAQELSNVLSERGR